MPINPILLTLPPFEDPPKPSLLEERYWTGTRLQHNLFTVGRSQAKRKIKTNCLDSRWHFGPYLLPKVRDLSDTNELQFSIFQTCL